MSDEPVQQPQTPANGRLSSGVVSLLATLLGVGILAVPYAVSRAGLVWGIVLTLIAAITSSLGLEAMIFASSCIPPGRASYYYISQRTVPELGIVFDLSVLFKCFGFIVAYLVVIGDLTPLVVDAILPHHFISHHAFLIARHVWITVFTLVLSVFSFKKHIQSIRNFAVASLISAAYVIVIVFVHSVHVLTRADEQILPGPIEVWEPRNWTRTLATFPILVLAFTCHQSFFSVINCQSNRSSGALRKINFSVIITGLIIYTLIGVAGYVSFGDKLVSNILKMYRNKFFVTVGRIVIIALVSVSFPAETEPLAVIINHIYVTNSRTAPPTMPSDNADSSHSPTESTPLTRHLDDFPLESDTPPVTVVDDIHIVAKEIEEANQRPGLDELTATHFYIIISVILILAYIITFYVVSLGKVLSIVGITSGSAFSYVLPGYFGYELADLLPETQGDRRNYIKYASGALAVWGALTTIVPLFAIILLDATKW